MGVSFFFRKSFCPQFGGLWHSLSAPEHLSFYAALRGFDKATIPSVTNEVLRAIGIDTDAAPAPNGNFSLPNTTAGSTVGSFKRVAELSGGNQRKLSAALALMGGPKIVYLDEPSTGVDVATRRHLWQIIRSHKEMRAVVLTTHSMDEADALSDRIAIMAQGKLKGEFPDRNDCRYVFEHRDICLGSTSHCFFLP